MAKTAYLDEDDRKLLFEIKQKLDEATKLMGELMDTIDVLSDSEMMKALKQGQDDIKAGRVKDLRSVLRKSSLKPKYKVVLSRQTERFYKKLGEKDKTSLRACLISLETTYILI